MKSRVISALVMFLVLVPIFFNGGPFYNITILLIGLLGIHEYLNIREEKKAIPDFMKFVAYIMFTIIVLANISNQNTVYSIDFKVISALFISMLLPVTLYHDRNIYSINDAFYLMGGVFFLGVSFNLFIVLRNISLYYLVYLFLITIITDSYAYFGGMLVGKTKLLESVSPKKTVEGTVIGSLVGTFIAAYFFHLVVNPELSMFVVIIMTLFLSILGQFGDLVFSFIKRYFGKKDFSNMIPGHGGILDRCDSIIFVILGFMFFISII